MTCRAARASLRLRFRVADWDITSAAIHLRIRLTSFMLSTKEIPLPLVKAGKGQRMTRRATVSETSIDTRIRRIKAHADHITSRAGVDTIEMLTAGANTPRGTPIFLENLLRARLVDSKAIFPVRRTDPLTNKKFIWRQRIVMNRVRFSALAEINEFQQKHGLILSRADVGAAIIGIDPDEWLDQLRFLVKQKFARQNRYEGQYDDVHYFADMKSDRYIVAYVAKGAEHGKAYLTGNCDPVAWLELRMGNRTLRRLGIDSACDLESINPQALFDQAIRWAYSNWVRERRKLEHIIKRECKDDHIWSSGYKRARYLSAYHRSYTLPRTPLGLTKQQLIEWLPGMLFVEKSGFF